MATEGAPAGPILTVEGLVAGYGGATILDGVNLAVPRAAITTVLGPNGAGKSTLLRTIFGLVPARHGKVMLERREVTNLPPRRMVERGVSYIPRGRNLVPDLSVRHNLELGGMVGRGRGWLSVRVDQLLDRFPALGRNAGRPAARLGAGEQKLLELARALVTEPILLLVDEPSIGLDADGMQAILTLLTELRNKGMAVLMIEQNAKSALGLSDHAVVMELGRTRHQDRAAAILTDPRIGQLLIGGAMGATQPPLPTMAATQP